MISRLFRTGLAAGVLGAACASLALPEAPAAAGLAFEEAVPAGSVVEGIGVGVHMAYEDTPYVDPGRVRDALGDLGVRHVRDDLFLRDPEQYAALRMLAAGGIGIDLIMGRPGGSAQAADYVAAAAEQLPAGSVESLEGPNEWDLSGRPGWVDELRAYQQDLFRAARAHPATADLPVLAPSLAFRRGYEALGPMPGASDVANGHLYTGGHAPSAQLDVSMSQLRAMTGNQRVVYTETGYTNATSTTSGHLPVPESVSATYLPRLIAEHASRGVERVYLYELVDEFDDASRTNIEAAFGLLRHDWSPKPAYLALRNLIDLLQDHGPEHSTRPLALSLTGGGPDLRRLLTQRRDGTYVLLLWRDVSVYDPAAKVARTVTPSSVTLELGAPAAIDLHRPSDSAESLAHVDGAALTVPLDGELVALTITPREVSTSTPSPSGSTSGAVPPIPSPSTAAPTAPGPGPSAPTVAPVPEPTAAPTTAPSVAPTSAPTDETDPPSPVGDPTTAPPSQATPAAVRYLRAVRRQGMWYVVWRAPAAGSLPTAYRLRVGGKRFDFSPSTRRFRISREHALTVRVRAGNAYGWGPVRVLRVRSLS